MVNKKRKEVSLLWVVLVLICIVVLAVVAAVLMAKPNKTINSFQECKNAGGSIAESYPEQCFIDGKSFTNDTQPLGGDSKTSAYVGLTEQAAADKATKDTKAHRVVERDGEALPVTADYSPGRLNFYVKDGRVYKVEVEGEEK